jgi:hypothetical protein
VWPKFLLTQGCSNSRDSWFGTRAPGPLGIRVIELPNIGPVLVAGMLLADMGARCCDSTATIAAGSALSAVRVAVLRDRYGRRSLGIAKHDQGAEVVLKL